MARLRERSKIDWNALTTVNQQKNKRSALLVCWIPHGRLWAVYLVSYIYTKPFSPEVLPSRNCCFTLKPLPGWGPQTTEPSEKFCLSTFSKYVSNVGATKNIASLTMGIERFLQPVGLFQNCSLQAVVKPGCLKWYNCMDSLPRVSLSFQSLFFR